jgi:hypothetical protein
MSRERQQPEEAKKNKTKTKNIFLTFDTQHDAQQSTPATEPFAFFCRNQTVIVVSTCSIASISNTIPLRYNHTNQWSAPIRV